VSRLTPPEFRIMFVYMDGATAHLDWSPQPEVQLVGKSQHARNLRGCVRPPESPESPESDATFTPHFSLPQYRMSESEVSATYPMLVPAEVLEPPFNDESRYICRRDAGELLDHHLQHLLQSRRPSRRLTLGRLAQVLLSRRAYRELGFASFW